MTLLPISLLMHNASQTTRISVLRSLMWMRQPWSTLSAWYDDVYTLIGCNRSSSSKYVGAALTLTKASVIKTSTDSFLKPLIVTCSKTYYYVCYQVNYGLTGIANVNWYACNSKSNLFNKYLYIIQSIIKIFYSFAQSMHHNNIIVITL